MARHGNSRHIKRLASSVYPRVNRKAATYLAKPMPGRHSLERSVALLVILRDKLNAAISKNEAKKVVKSGGVEVNGMVVRDERYPVGFGDLIKLKQPQETYAVGIGKRGDIRIEKVEGREEARTLKVVGKYLAKGSKVMLRLYDGSTMSGAKDVRVNDSVVLSGGKVKSVLRFEQGAKCLVIDGTHASERGVIKEIKKGTVVNEMAVRVEGEGGEFETPAGNVMVVGA